MKGWRIIEDPVVRDGAWNMAVDEVLYRNCETGKSEKPILRVYEWSRPCLSLGYHQRMDSGCDDSLCRNRGIDIVRRPTGGRAVLHADEVTYSVVGLLSEPPFEGLNLTGVYLLVADAIAEGLKSLGLDIKVSKREAPVSPASSEPCFAIPTSGEILLDGRKVVGSAQRRGNRAFLQHGAIPLNIDYDLLAMVTCKGSQEARRFQTLFTGVGAFGVKITRGSLKDAIIEGFRNTFDGPWEVDKLDVREKADAALLRREKYLSERWTRAGTGIQGMKPSETTEF